MNIIEERIMSISISNVFQAVASDKYNKKYIAVYLILYFIIAVSYCFINQSASKVLALTGIAVFLLSSVFHSGLYIITSNNEINNEESVFPSPCQILNVFKYGIVYFVVLSIVCFLLYLIPTVLAYFASFLMIMSVYGAFYLLIPAFIILLISIVIFFVLGYFYLYPLVIQYLISLKFVDLFNFKKAVNFRKERKGIYREFFWKSFLLYFIAGIIGCIVKFVIFKAFSANLASLNPQTLSAMGGYIIGTVSCILTVLYIPNLIAQVVAQKNEINE